MTFNLANNPVGRAGTTGYTAQAATGTPVISIGQGPGGGPAGIADYWIRATTSVATASVDITNSGASASPVDSGTVYTFSVSVHPTSATTITAMAIIQWFDGSNGLIGSSAGTPTVVSSGVWSGRISVTATAPPTAARAGLVIRVSSSSTFSAGFVHIATGFMLEAASQVNPYYDGNFLNYMWSAAPDLSPSWGPVMTVVANPLNTPPRNEINIQIPPGYVMNSVLVNRVVNGVPTPLRTQPSPGFDSRLVYDYEVPYDTSAAYEVLTTFTNPAGLVNVWSESWSNLSAWSGNTSGWSVSGGTASGGDGTPAGYTITRSIPTPGKYRVSVDQLTTTAASTLAPSGLTLFSGSTTVLQIVPSNTSSALKIITSTLTKTTSVSGYNPFTVDILDDTIVLSGTGGSYTLSGNKTISSVQLTAKGPGVTQVGAITVQSYPQDYDEDVTSYTVGLSPVNSWMIHPANPGLSMPISSTDQSALMIRTIGDITDPSSATEHTILGQALPIITTNGPRFGNRLQMVLGVRNRDQELALKTLLADGTPLLFRFPASFDIGFDEGFYSVGDVQRTRFAQRPGIGLRNVTLALTEVQSPVVNVANSGWSYAALAAGLKSFAILTSAYDSFADMEVDNRNAGY